MVPFYYLYRQGYGSYNYFMWIENSCEYDGATATSTATFMLVESEVSVARVYRAVWSRENWILCWDVVIRPL